MRLLIMAFSLLSIAGFAQKDKKGTIKVKKEKIDTSIYVIADEPAQYSGGDMALTNFIVSKIRYPESARINKITGICYITFIVDANGFVSNVRILRGVSGCPECDAEARRVVMSMPAWAPAKNKGKPVRVQYNLPIKFVL